MHAAEPPTIYNMSVSASENGVSAGCEFSGYRDKGEYVIQLYLYRIKEDGQKVEISYEELTATGDGKGSGSTAAMHVESGIYKASTAIKRYEEGNLAATAFTDSSLYRVVREGDSYIVTPWPEMSGNENKPGSMFFQSKVNLKDIPEKEKETSKYPVCDHDIIYEIVQEADPRRDALQAEQCSKCSEVFSYSYIPNSAYAAFLKESAVKIQNAEEKEILITTDRWMSFNQEVLDAIAARPETVISIYYVDGGKPYTVTIPAGTDAAGLADENGYCGFRCLCKLYGGKEVFS